MELPAGRPGPQTLPCTSKPQSRPRPPCCSPPAPGPHPGVTPWSTRASGGGRDRWHQPSPGDEPPADISHSETHLHVHYPTSQNPFPAQKYAVLILPTTLRGRTWDQQEKRRRGQGGRPPTKQRSHRRPHKGSRGLGRKGQTILCHPSAWKWNLMPPTPASWS